MKSLLVAGPDSSLRDVYVIAQSAHGDRRVSMLSLPSSDYYHFDLSGLKAFPPDEWDICIAVNEFYINDVRRALHVCTEALGYRSTSVVSPNSSVDSSVIIGDNVIVYPGCFVGAGTILGHHSVLRPNVVLSEDVNVGCYVTLEANVSVRERSKIGDYTIVGANSSLVRMTEIGAHCYLNLPRQYSGVIPACTFYSPIFQNPVRVLSS